MKDGKGKAKATENGKWKGKWKGTGTGKGIVKQTPGGEIPQTSQNLLGIRGMGHIELTRPGILTA
jgi:hypothetical protein